MSACSVKNKKTHYACKIHIAGEIFFVIQMAFHIILPWSFKKPCTMWLQKMTLYYSVCPFSVNGNDTLILASLQSLFPTQSPSEMLGCPCESGGTQERSTGVPTGYTCALPSTKFHTHSTHLLSFLFGVFGQHLMHNRPIWRSNHYL